MKFSKKSRYGIRALVDLAVNSKEEQVSLSSIAERNQISVQYLEQVFASLRRAGIVKSIKGPQGGYLLGRDARDIHVSDIVEALEGGYQLEDEVLHDDACREIQQTMQRLIIDQVNLKLKELLDDITLEDLEKDYVNSISQSQDMYYI